jgi:hypothetical protein
VPYVNSVDFCSSLAGWFGSFQKSDVNSKTISLGMQLLGTMTEFVQGPCVKNQDTLVKCKIIENCKDFLSMFGPGSSDLLLKGFGVDTSAVDEMKQQCVVLLSSLLEGAANPETFKRMAESLGDFSICFERMTNVY